MPRPDSQDPLLPSLIDRLIDREPDVSTEPAWRQSQNLREYQQSVLRDLEALLNTRQSAGDLPADFEESICSILTYGLPEFLSISVGSNQEREYLSTAVQNAIKHFEPRLRQVVVQVKAPTSPHDRNISMSIDAVLWVEPDPLPVSFDTLVQPSSGQCKIQSR